MLSFFSVCCLTYAYGPQLGFLRSLGVTAEEELTWGFPFVEHTLDILSQYQGEKEEKKIKKEE